MARPGICLIIVFLCFSVQLSAQNVNFSLYQDAPFFTNPALLAANKDINLSVIHRSQALTEFNRYNTSSLMLIVPNMNPDNHKRTGGWGISFLHDEVKGGFDFRTQGLSASYAYGLPLFKNQYLSLGLQGGLYQRYLSTSGYSTSSQWSDGIGYVPSMGTGEAMEDGRINYLALSTGLLYHFEDENHRQIARLGIAAFNLNRPNLSVSTRKSLLPVKYVAHGNLALMRSEKVMIQSEMLFFRENGINTYHPGIRTCYYFPDNNPFDPLREGRLEFKGGYRVGNAVTTEIQFIQPNFTLAFAYDFGISGNKSYRSPNDVPEILFTVRKVIQGKKKHEKATETTGHNSAGKVRDFHFDDTEEQITAKEIEEHLEASVEQKGKGFKVIHNFNFKFNGYLFNDESRVFLDKMVNLLKDNENMVLQVIGHTDNVGNAANNQKISMKRAEAVINYLIEKGVDASRLSATAMGARRPLAPNNSEANKALNRRVEFVLNVK